MEMMQETHEFSKKSTISYEEMKKNKSLDEFF